MKKILFILAIALFITVAVMALVYWYVQPDKVNIVGSLQTIALDDLSIDSFDDVCTKELDGQLSCVGNIEQFGCERYRRIDEMFQDLKPYYPMLICENVANTGSIDAHQVTGGVYAVTGSGWMAGRATLVKYIMIRDNTFQLIESEDHFSQLFQPIESVQEASAYFQALHKAVLVLDEATLTKLKNSSHGEYLVTLDAVTLSSVSETDDGFIVTAYSDNTLSCKTEWYRLTFLLERNGNAIEQSNTLIWQSNLECTS